MSPLKDDYDRFVHITNDCEGAWTRMPRRISARQREAAHLDEEVDMTSDLSPNVGADQKMDSPDATVTTAMPAVLMCDG